MFKAGQRVICIDEKMSGELITGRIYTIDIAFSNCVGFKELPRRMYHNSRFMLVNEDNQSPFSKWEKGVSCSA